MYLCIIGIQTGLDNTWYEWCNNNGMSLNIDKICFIVSYYIYKKNTLSFNYI